MRWASLLLAWTVCVGAEVSPLLDRSEDLARIWPALMDLSKGRTGTLEGLPTEVFLAPAGITDEQDPDLIHRWTFSLQKALDRLDPQQRSRVLDSLDRRCTLALDGITGVDRTRIATAFLPAPSAIAVLAQEADRAFDHGDFRPFLGMSDLLCETDGRRTTVANTLLGAGPEVDPTAALQAPGPPIPTAASTEDPTQGMTVTWKVQPGWLIAADPWGDVRWQYRLELTTAIVHGPGGAIIRDGRGLRLIDENGRIRSLPAPPAGARILAVAGGAAWFALDSRIHRLDAESLVVSSLDLPSPPIGGPLVRGPDALWLTENWLVLQRGAGTGIRFRHGLPCGDAWSLGSEFGQPLIIDPNGQSQRIPDLNQLLEHAEPGERIALLVRAGRAQEALDVGLADPALREDPEVIHHLVTALLLLNNARMLETSGLPLTENPSERMRVLAGLWRLAEAQSRTQWEQRISALAASAPGIWIDLDGEDAFAGPEDWNWRSTGAGWLARGSPRPAAILPENDRQALTAQRSEPVREPTSRDRDGSLRYLGLSLRCEPGLRWTVLTCSQDGIERWRRRWPTPDPLAAPGRELWASDGCVLVVEGAARLRAWSLADGAEVVNLPLAGHDVGARSVTVLGQDRVAELRPPWLQHEVRLRDTNGVRVIALPDRARWMIAWRGGAIAALTSGGFALIDTSDPPMAGLASGDRPEAEADGLHGAAGAFWPWSP